MMRSELLCVSPDCASLHPGYALSHVDGVVYGMVMSADDFDRLPAERRRAVCAALAAAFWARSDRRDRADYWRCVDGIDLSPGYRRPALSVAGGGRAKPAAQSVSTCLDAHRGGGGDRPKIRYIDETARIAVIDFIDQRPLKAYPGGARALAQALGELFARVQATPAFPHFVNYPDIVARLFAHVRRPVASRPACWMRM